MENRKTSPCFPRAPNLLHVLPSWMVGWNKLCNPVDKASNDASDGASNDACDDEASSAEPTASMLI